MKKGLFSSIFNKKLSNEKGVISLSITVLCLMGVLLVAFLVDRSYENFMFQEVRGMMDAAGQNTLVSVLSDSHLKEELFGFSGLTISSSSDDQPKAIPTSLKEQLKQTYKKELNRYVTTNDRLLVFDVSRIEFKFAKGTWGMGASASKSRPYLVIDSVVRLRIAHTQAFDYSSSFKNQTFKDVNGNEFTIQALTANESTSELFLVVRSVSRAVFR